MALSSGLFAGIAKAQATTQSRFFHQGSFITVLNKIVDRTGANKTRNSGNAIIFEQKVLVVRDAGGVENPLRPGQTVAHMISDGGKRADMFLPNVKAALGQIVQAAEPSFDPETTSEEDWMRLLDLALTQQKLSGLFLSVVCTPIVTRDNRPFTRINYERVLSARELRGTFQALNLSEETVFPGGALQTLVDAEIKAVEEAKQAAAKVA